MNDEIRPVRWWLLYVILVLSVLAALMIWIPDRPDMSIQVVGTAGLLILTLLSLLLWLFVFSRLSGKIRVRAVIVILLFVFLAAATIRIKGFSGDLVPLLEWRNYSVEPTVGTGHTLSDSFFDYPQFLGPNRNATLGGIRLSRDWSTHPPKLLWRIPVGEGWSAFAVVGRSAITQEQKGEHETVTCYDLLTGKQRWQHKDPARYDTAVGGIGPRATPTISGKKVYTFGATGILNCLDLETGNLQWSRNTLKDANAVVNDWGMSGSPLILDNHVIVSPGGTNGLSMFAYRKDSGEKLWSGGTAQAGYSSPSLTTLAGSGQILIFNRGEVASHEPETGRVLWKRPWPTHGGAQHVAQPVSLPGDRVFASMGYGGGSKLYHVSKESDTFSADILWENTNLKAKFTNVVHKDGFIYGLDNGILVCLDLETGKRKWKRGRYGHGQLILVNDLLLIQAESGEVVLVDADPDGLNERARLPLLTRKTWNNPTLAGPYLLIRNDREAACYELALEGTE